MTNEQRRAAQAEYGAKARADYEALLGKIILVEYLTGYCEASSDSHNLNLSTPARMRVSKSGDCMVNRTCGNWIDPVYDLELLEPHPELIGYGFFECYGTSYNIETGEVQPASFRLVADAANLTPAEVTPEMIFDNNKIVHSVEVLAPEPQKLSSIGGSVAIVIDETQVSDISIGPGVVGSGSVNIAQIGGVSLPNDDAREHFRVTASGRAASIAEAVSDLTDEQIDVYLSTNTWSDHSPRVREFFEGVAHDR